MVTTIVKKSCPYDKQTLLDMQNVGFTDEFKLKMPMERARGRPSASQEAMDRFARRPAMSLWPWQATCSCGNVRDKSQLKSNGGLCEHCRPETGD
jgi:hypothetical protein